MPGLSQFLMAQVVHCGQRSLVLVQQRRPVGIVALQFIQRRQHAKIRKRQHIAIHGIFSWCEGWIAHW
jgi:hypothetical protein